MLVGLFHQEAITVTKYLRCLGFGGTQTSTHSLSDREEPSLDFCEPVSSTTVQR